jgi:hypothetical protein
MSYTLILLAISTKPGVDPVKSAQGTLAATNRRPTRNLEGLGMEKRRLARSLLEAFPELHTYDTIVMAETATATELADLGSRTVEIDSPESAGWAILAIDNYAIAIEFSASLAVDSHGALSKEIQGYIQFLKVAKGYQVYDPQMEMIWTQ